MTTETPQSAKENYTPTGVIVVVVIIVVVPANNDAVAKRFATCTDDICCPVLIL